MKDLDKSECVRPALSSHTGTSRLNGTGVLSEESKELPEVHLSLIAGFQKTLIKLIVLGGNDHSLSQE